MFERATGRTGVAERTSQEDPMPAVTVDNVLALPRVPGTDPALDRGRPVLSVTTAPSGLEGEGFPVRRALTPSG